ncbi:Peroxidasin-like protein [Harpegnathos saltator]|uniref:Peroxidasin-like protein n=1 Tax=Harpegnathos saltator TaxID=610380 RepID=E2B919_HARSA|nr:Peroxidasin-like protein [Harpegnathos saltator]
MDDVMPGTKPPPTSVVFVDVPEHTETELGSSALLACRTADPVAECQWSWQPLPPVHLPLPDISESPPVSTTTVISPISTTATPTTHPLPVRQFPAFGNNSNDCSVRFSSTKHEQTGYWTCAARISTTDPFTNTEPAKLSIVNANHGILITFVKHENIIEVPAGSSAQIMCQTKSPVRECQWSWRQLNQSQPWNLDVKSFPAFGNDSTECSIKFKNVLPEQEGYWTCGARIDPNSSFTQSTPVRFLISEVEFVQLSRGVQVAAGESVFLRCLANKPVVQCEWSWRASNSSKEPLVVKKFGPNKDAEHDCSVRFKNILYDEEGLWTCGVRLTPDGILHTAPAATVSLLPTAKVNFVQVPTDMAVLVGTETTLKCVTSSRVEKCAWTWRPLHSSDSEIVVEEFPSNGDLGRDCSLNLPHVYVEKQGHWGCQVSIASLNTVLTSPPAKLTVFEQDEVKFSELSQDIQISSGGSVLLRCVTSSTVEQCRWSLTPVNSNTTVVVKQFPAAGNEARDCSVRLSHALAEQEGLWTCGARIRGRQNYTDAPPAKLSLLEPEPVTVAVWATPHQMVTLACRVGVVSSETKCHWIHAPKIHIHQNSSKPQQAKKMRHNVQMDYITGVCKLVFKPDHSDLGQWTCKFTVTNENAEIEIGNASLVLLNTLADKKLGWIVGALTAMILFLMIIVVVLVVCKTRIFIRKTPEILETLPSNERERSARCCNDRYNENSGKINFGFSAAESSRTSNIDSVLSNRSPRIYNRAERIHETSKIYENVGL